MIAIFYNKKMLNDTLIVNINNKKITTQITNDNFVIGYSDENEVSFINIFNFSKYMNLLDGYVHNYIISFIDDIVLSFIFVILYPLFIVIFGFNTSNFVNKLV